MEVQCLSTSVEVIYVETDRRHGGLILIFHYMAIFNVELSLCKKMSFDLILVVGENIHDILQ